MLRAIQQLNFCDKSSKIRLNQEFVILNVLQFFRGLFEVIRYGALQAHEVNIEHVILAVLQLHLVEEVLKNLFHQIRSCRIDRRDHLNDVELKKMFAFP